MQIQHEPIKRFGKNIYINYKILFVLMKQYK